MLFLMITVICPAEGIEKERAKRKQPSRENRPSTNTTYLP